MPPNTIPMASVHNRQRRLLCVNVSLKRVDKCSNSSTVLLIAPDFKFSITDFFAFDFGETDIRFEFSIVISGCWLDAVINDWLMFDLWLSKSESIELVQPPFISLSIWCCSMFNIFISPPPFQSKYDKTTKKKPRKNQVSRSKHVIAYNNNNRITRGHCFCFEYFPCFHQSVDKSIFLLHRLTPIAYTLVAFFPGFPSSLFS